MYSPKTTVDFEKKVVAALREQIGGFEPLETPIRLSLAFFMPIPKSFSKKRIKDCLNGTERYTKKPDLDNLAKAVMDAMNGILYKDDSQICSLELGKYYSTTPCVEVFFCELVP